MEKYIVGKNNHINIILDDTYNDKFHIEDVNNNSIKIDIKKVNDNIPSEYVTDISIGNLNQDNILSVTKIGIDGEENTQTYELPGNVFTTINYNENTRTLHTYKYRGDYDTEKETYIKEKDYSLDVHDKYYIDTIKIDDYGFINFIFKDNESNEYTEQYILTERGIKHLYPFLNNSNYNNDYYFKVYDKYVIQVFGEFVTRSSYNTNKLIYLYNNSSSSNSLFSLLEKNNDNLYKNQLSVMTEEQMSEIEDDFNGRYTRENIWKQFRYNTVNIDKTNDWYLWDNDNQLEDFDWNFFIYNENKKPIQHFYNSGVYNNFKFLTESARFYCYYDHSYYSSYPLGYKYNNETKKWEQISSKGEYHYNSETSEGIWKSDCEEFTTLDYRLLTYIGSDSIVKWPFYLYGETSRPYCKDNTKIYSVTFLNPNQLLAPESFCGCTSLSTLTAEEKYTENGEEKVREVTPLNLYIPYRALEGTQLSEIDLSNIYFIGSQCFKDMTSLDKITWPESRIEWLPALGYGSEYDKYTDPNMDGTGIGQQYDVTRWFYSTSSYKYIYYNDSVFYNTAVDEECIDFTKLPIDICGYDYNFYKTNFKTLELKEATSIGDYTFAECNNLETVTAPLVEKVDTYSFYNDYNLTKADFVKATSLGDYAFKNDYNLVEGNFPFVETIQDSFNHCNSEDLILTIPCLTSGNFIDVGFKEIYLPLMLKWGVRSEETHNYHLFEKCYNLNKINMPLLETCIYNYEMDDNSLCYQCYNLTDINLPKVTSGHLFNQCSIKMDTLNLPYFQKGIIFSHDSYNNINILNLDNATSPMSVDIGGYGIYEVNVNNITEDLELGYQYYGGDVYIPSLKTNYSETTRHYIDLLALPELEHIKTDAPEITGEFCEFKKEVSYGYPIGKTEVLVYAGQGGVPPYYWADWKNPITYSNYTFNEDVDIAFSEWVGMKTSRAGYTKYFYNIDTTSVIDSLNNPVKAYVIKYYEQEYYDNDITISACDDNKLDSLVKIKFWYKHYDEGITSENTYITKISTLDRVYLSGYYDSTVYSTGASAQNIIISNNFQEGYFYTKDEMKPLRNENYTTRTKTNIFFDWENVSGKVHFLGGNQLTNVYYIGTLEEAARYLIPFQRGVDQNISLYICSSYSDAISKYKNGGGTPDITYNVDNCYEIAEEILTSLSSDDDTTS